jgi:hypothetical protein
MTDTSRRKLIAVAGAGAAAGAVALTPGMAFARETRVRDGGATDSVVAYIEDHRSDTLRLMVGEREVVVRDRDLVARILNAAGRTDEKGH